MRKVRKEDSLIKVLKHTTRKKYTKGTVPIKKVQHFPTKLMYTGDKGKKEEEDKKLKDGK